MASIKPRTGKNGITTYLITVSMGRDTNGKKKFETTTFKPTKTTPKAIEKEVQKFALDFEERVKAGKYFSGEKLTFYDVAKQWEPDAKENLSIATFESYQDILKKHIYTSATLLLAHGTDIETVSHRLGHSKASVTLDVYGHALKKMDSTASDTLESIFSRKQA